MNTPIGKLTPAVTTAFDPRTIPGCAIWYDAADPNGNGTLPANGASVSVWVDKSGNGKNTTTSIAPSFSANSLNNLGTIRFNGSSGTTYFLDTPAFDFGTSTRSAFFIIQNTGPASGAGSVPHWFWPLTGNGTNALSIVTWMATRIQGTTQNIVASPNKNQYYIVSYRFGVTAGFEELFLNGTSSGTYTKSTGGTSYANATSGYRLGWLTGDPNTAYPFDGNMGEVLLFNTALTDPQRQQLEGYLARKWGLTSSLPATHPFRSLPPMPRMFQPIDISGCTLWLDAADNTTFTYSGANITQWNDKSGNANHASNSTGTMLPTLGTSSVSLPAVDFNSAYLMNNNAFGLSNMSVFVVGEERATNASNVYSGIIVFKGISGGPNAGTTEDYAQTNAILIATPNSTETTTNLQVYAQLPPFPQLSGTGGNGYWTYRLYEVFIRTGTASEIFLNGTSNASYTLKNRTGNSVGYLLSARQFNGSFTVGRLKHSEVLSYDRVLSTSERQQVESYLANKWALRGNLASTHPFKLYDAVTPAFTPVQISGCQLWLDTADSNTVALSGTAVTQWNDKSGNTRNLASITAGTGSVTYSTYGGIPSILLTSTSPNTAYMRVNSAVDLTNFSIFAISRCQGQRNNQNALLGIPSTRWSYDSTDGFGMYIDSDSANQRDRFYGSLVANVVTNGNASGTDAYPLRMMCWTNTSAGVLSSWYNGNTGTTNSSGSARASTCAGFGIGFEIQGSNGTPNLPNCISQFSEFIVYNQIVSTSQRQAVEGYLANKWGLLNNLPASHPYKKFRP